MNVPEGLNEVPNNNAKLAAQLRALAKGLGVEEPPEDESDTHTGDEQEQGLSDDNTTGDEQEQTPSEDPSTETTPGPRPAGQTINKLIIGLQIVFLLMLGGIGWFGWQTHQANNQLLQIAAAVSDDGPGPITPPEGDSPVSVAPGGGDGTAQAETGTALAETGTALAETGTALAETGTAQAETGTALAETGTALAETGTAQAETSTALATDEADSSRGDETVQLTQGGAPPVVWLHELPHVRFEIADDSLSVARGVTVTLAFLDEVEGTEPFSVTLEQDTTDAKVFQGVIDDEGLQTLRGRNEHSPLTLIVDGTIYRSCRVVVVPRLVLVWAIPDPEPGETEADIPWSIPKGEDTDDFLRKLDTSENGAENRDFTDEPELKDARTENPLLQIHLWGGCADNSPVVGERGQWPVLYNGTKVKLLDQDQEGACYYVQVLETDDASSRDVSAFVKKKYIDGGE